MIRAALWLLPFRLLHRGVAFFTERFRRSASTGTIRAETVAWAVTVAARRVPAATCLTQALAGMLLLARHGHAAELRVGVARGDDGALRAHAWVDSGGRTILGGAESSDFTPFPPVALPR
jgi:hypothetical protein